MRATDLLITIGAGLGFASANVDCNPKALHDTAQVIADSANEGFKKSVKDLCSSHNDKNNTEHHFGLITLGLNRTCSDCTWNVFCAQQFDSIIKECVVGQTLAGGTAKMKGMTVEVSIDASLIETAQAKAQDFRKMRMARMVKRGGKTKPKKEKTTHKSEDKSTTEPEQDSSKTKPKEPKTTPKPKKTKAKACRARKNPGEKTPGKEKTHGKEKASGKKGSKNALRSVISKLFPRAPPSSDDFPMSPSDEDEMKKIPSPGKGKGKGKAEEEFPASSSQEEALNKGCEDVEKGVEKMHKPGGWPGEVWFGKAQPKTAAPTKQELQDIALVNYKYIQDNIGHAHILVVAALYVPGKGIFLGTIPAGGAENKFKEELESFTKLSTELTGRWTEHKNNALYHAEDAAMWYAFKNGAVGANQQFPKGSKMGVFGSKGKVSKPGERMNPCEGESVHPSCKDVLAKMISKV